MLDMAATAADRLGQILTDEFKRNFGSGHSDRAERLGSIARVALECLARSDALYHTVEHTFLVTLVGLDMCVAGASPSGSHRTSSITC